MLSSEHKQNDSKTPAASVYMDTFTEDCKQDMPRIAETPIVEKLEVEDDEKNVGKEDCDALYKECVRVQVENARCAEKIKRINKVVVRIQRERRFLMKKLDGFGDDYHAAKQKVVEEEEARIATALQEDQELAMKESKKPKKKVKVKRLQNAPKKPTNAFLMFCQKNRDVVQGQYNKSEISRQEMTRKLAEIWQKTSQEDRKAYYEMYEKDKARYTQEMKAFESKSSASTDIAVAATAPTDQRLLPEMKLPSSDN